jgi:CxxC motif-containing protein (DUF1111 family)
VLEFLQFTSRVRKKLTIVAIFARVLSAQHDPGPRAHDPAFGGIMNGLTGAERELFRSGLEAFETINSVQGDAFVPQSEVGLGPTFNMDSCAGCHAYPSSGGSRPEANPQPAANHPYDRNAPSATPRLRKGIQINDQT